MIRPAALARRFALLIALVLAAACTARGSLTILPEAAGQGELRPVFVATSRSPEGDGAAFGRRPSDRLHFARYEVSIPPGREPGSIPYPGPGRPDPARHFLTIAAELYEGPGDFRRALAAELRRRPAGERDAVLFVHGFNTRYAEGIYRIAQLTHDLALPGVAVHYAWPSAGNVLVYAHDRDAALFARDGLEALIAETHAAGARRIILVAHSLGAALTMEALRQIAIGGRRDLMAAVGGVILSSPDIDVNVFRAQARRIGRLPQPFLIFTSRRDRALAVSAFLTGEGERLGNLRDPAPLADLEVTLIEVGAYSTGLGHFTLGESPTLIRLLGALWELDRAFAGDPGERPGLFLGAVLSVRNATQIILAPFEALAGELGN